MTPERYHPPVKRSVTIAGHPTSISLEPLFWQLLKRAAEERDEPLSALIGRIDAERLESDTTPGLAGAIRLWLVDRLIEQGEGPPAAPPASQGTVSS